MADKTYPVGTKVIFIAKPDYNRVAREDSGKIATITRTNGYSASIFILGSENNSYISGRNPKVTWAVPWGDIKPLKNQQLEFAFMSEEL